MSLWTAPLSSPPWDLCFSPLPLMGGRIGKSCLRKSGGVHFHDFDTATSLATLAPNGTSPRADEAFTACNSLPHTVAAIFGGTPAVVRKWVGWGRLVGPMPNRPSRFAVFPAHYFHVTKFGSQLVELAIAPKFPLASQSFHTQRPKDMTIYTHLKTPEFDNVYIFGIYAKILYLKTIRKFSKRFQSSFPEVSATLGPPPLFHALKNDWGNASALRRQEPSHPHRCFRERMRNNTGVKPFFLS